MITIDDIKRVIDPEQSKKHRLDNLAKACSNAKSDDMKTMWYNKLKKLSEEYDMMDYFRTLIH
tara:strand:- start:14 stop:202 length:189 start_codon:yes stop_codon:yes gene_type:complete